MIEERGNMFTAIRDQKGLYNFLDGGGEITEIIKSRNWDDTAVGPISSWPTNLKTALSIILNSKFPMFLYWGPDLLCFYNEAYRPSLGAGGKHPDAIGQPARDVWPEIWPAIYPLIKNLFEGGEATLMKDVLLPIYRNGRLEDVYWTFSYSAILDEYSICNGIFVTCTETTENIKTLKELHESKEELEFAINAADLATWELNTSTYKITGNDRFKQWFGIDHHQNLDVRTFTEQVSVKDRARVVATLHEALRFSSGGTYNAEFSIINQLNGLERTVLAKGKTLFDENNVPVRFNGILQDVTEERIASLALFDAEERARLAADAVDLGTFDMNLITGEMITSTTFDAIFGFQEKVPRAAFVYAIHPEDRSLRINAHRRAVETGKLFYEVRVIWPDKSIHWIRIEGKIYFSDASRPVRIIGTVLDISDRIQSQLELVKMNQQMEVALAEQKALQRQKDEFIGIASHELKTPVTSIKAYTQVLERILTKKGDLKEAAMMTKMDVQLSRLTSLIGDLLDVTKMNSGRLQFNNTDFDLNDMIRFVVEDLQRTTDQHTIIENFTAVGSVYGDKERLEQVVTNLLTNAIKYSPSGKEILVSTKLEDNHIFVSVQDHGIGISKENLEKVFEQFYRVSGKMQHTFSGLGLGLYISSEIIRREGGKLWVESEEGAGSTFTFSIPVKN
jgi:signal transduction histidine kinase